MCYLVLIIVLLIFGVFLMVMLAGNGQKYVVSSPAPRIDPLPSPAISWEAFQRLVDRDKDERIT